MQISFNRLKSNDEISLHIIVLENVEILQQFLNEEVITIPFGICAVVLIRMQQVLAI